MFTVNLLISIFTFQLYQHNIKTDNLLDLLCCPKQQKYPPGALNQQKWTRAAKREVGCRTVFITSIYMFHDLRNIFKSSPISTASLPLYRIHLHQRLRRGHLHTETHINKEKLTKGFSYNLIMWSNMSALI